MSGSEKQFSFWMMPLSVLLFGLLSIGLLLWADHIRESLLLDENRVDAIKDVRIDIVTYHLRLEEVESGGGAAGVQEAERSLRHALTAVGVILAGGTYGIDSIGEPLKPAEMHTCAEEIALTIGELGRVGRQRLTVPVRSEAAARLEEKFESLFQACLSEAARLEGMLQRDEEANQAKSLRLYRCITLCWSFLIIAAAAGLWSREKARKKAEQKLLDANVNLSAQSEELLEHRQHLAEMVEQRTAELRVANEIIQAEAADRLQTCQALQDSERQIRRLSSKLLQAQELERKRISRELHDELGQALNVVKLRLGFIKRSLAAERRPEQEACRELLEYIDEIIENVRRISLDLSPTVLEGLGLTAALCWLVDTLNGVSDLEARAEIAEIDALFPAEQWITIYRVMQEAITNCHKHSAAGVMSVSIRQSDGAVLFSVQDDGKGFDIEEAMAKQAAGKGLGLSTMAERIAMMGGAVELWSEQGKGTRITFSIPDGEGTCSVMGS